MSRRIIIVTGAPGAGKSTTARLLAEQSPSDRAVHLHTDDFYAYIRKGYIQPWEPDSQNQNQVVVDAIINTARAYANGGYDVLIDGIIGPWFLEPFRIAAHHRFDVRYIILRPDERTTTQRVLDRGEHVGLPVETVGEVSRQMLGLFQDLGPYEANVIDSSNQTVEETVALIATRLATGDFQLS